MTLKIDKILQSNIMPKGKILKIKLGYPANCSAAFGRFDIFIIPIEILIINLAQSVIIASILYKKYGKKKMRELMKEAEKLKEVSEGTEIIKKHNET